MRTDAAILTSLGVGAGMAYLLDPAMGRRRRAGVRDTVARVATKSGDALGATSRDVANRARGFLAVTARRGRQEDVSDGVLAERVRSRLGRYVSHPRAVDIEAENAVVTLRGPILTREAARLRRVVRRIRGVRGIEDRLERHDEPGDVPALQGGVARPGERHALGQTSWSPASRLAVGVAGVAVLGIGLRRRHWLGAALSAAGSALVARALTDMELSRLIGVGAGRRAVEFEKTITIGAPVRDVFAFWQHYENFPRFMTHVRDVQSREEDAESHWIVDGPAGLPISFDARTIQVVPETLIAWESLEGSIVAHEGAVRFEPEPNGGTRVNVRFSYTPPAGAVGHAVAWLAGADAKQRFDDDLARMKTLIETGRPARDAAQR